MDEDPFAYERPLSPAEVGKYYECYRSLSPTSRWLPEDKQYEELEEEDDNDEEYEVIRVVIAPECKEYEFQEEDEEVSEGETDTEVRAI